MFAYPFTEKFDIAQKLGHVAEHTGDKLSKVAGHTGEKLGQVAGHTGEKLGQVAEQVVEQTGDYLEQKIGERLEQSRMDAPELKGKPQKKVWYKIFLKNGICGDGSNYHIYLKKGTRNRLCIFFSGGGVAWDDFTADRPVTGGKVITGQPNFYWNNLRPFTQIMNINVGITETDRKRNPFDSWCFIVVTYATGDFHVGNSDYRYESGDGRHQVVHFRGHRNFEEAMKVARKYFPNPKRLLIAGDSAGAFAVPALTPEIIENYYPKCKDVTCFSDSALLHFGDWKRTAKDIWGADQRIWQQIQGENLIFDWYKSLTDKYGSRIRYLFACSSHDYLLSTFYNAVQNKDYSTDEGVQAVFADQLTELVCLLKGLSPEFGIFINNWKYPLTGIGKGGTVHTAVRKPSFHVKNEKVSMARWLFDAVNGRVYDVGLSWLGLTSDEV